MRQSQGRPGSTDRFPGLLTHGKIRVDIFEAQNKGLNVLFILEEEREGPLDGNRYPMYICSTLCWLVTLFSKIL